MRVVAIIPARMGSSRFPGKPLADILGRTMIEHVFRRARSSASIAETIIATCDKEIQTVAEGFGARVVMTSPRHERASDRIAEAAQDIQADIVVLLQGDEPMIRPEMIDMAVTPMLKDPTLECINLARRIVDAAEYRDPNTIKVVVDQRGNALFMTRQPIPTLSPQGLAETPVFKQVCVIPFTRKSLLNYARLSPTPLERLESIDMLRLIEHGHAVRMIDTPYDTRAVDTPEDLAHVTELMRQAEDSGPAGGTA
jgi:3-deoxy-manno-octulosonate cytidylyltransferase (CMP-KDO synthetase)